MAAAIPLLSGDGLNVHPSLEADDPSLYNDLLGTWACQIESKNDTGYIKYVFFYDRYTIKCDYMKFIQRQSRNPSSYTLHTTKTSEPCIPEMHGNIIALKYRAILKIQQVDNGKMTLIKEEFMNFERKFLWSPESNSLLSLTRSSSECESYQKRD